MLPISTAAAAVPLVQPVPLLRGYNVLSALDANGTLTTILAGDITESAYFFVPGFASLGSSCAEPLKGDANLAMDTSPWTYMFDRLEDWTADQIEAIRTGFAKWQFADSKVSLNIQFAETTRPQLALTGGKEMILLVKDLPYDDTGTEVTGLTTQEPAADGKYRHALIEFTTNRANLRGKIGYLKLALHEIGHLHHLDHTTGFGTPQGSVMNQWLYNLGGRTWDDSAMNVPITVPYCDYANAAKYIR